MMGRLKSPVLPWLLLCLGPAITLSQPRLDLVGGTTFDFGDVYAGTTVHRDLTLKNSGTDTMVISDVSTSCGCTGTLMSSDHVPPNGNGTLSISFNSAKYAGKVSKVVTLNTNDTSHGHVRITFTANVIKSLSLDPEYLVFHTSVDSSVTQDLSIVNSGASRVRILSATSSSDRLTLKLTSDRIDPGDGSVLKCTLAPSDQGVLNGTITIKTDREKIPVITVRFFALVGAKGTHPRVPNEN
ncbi:MAG TPA: DUF1573 domain-containing protein [Bacteroidota bacterium]|jgi:hypothetical protein